MSSTKRYLHLRHDAGFTPELFEQFKAHCRIWTAYTEAVISNWRQLGLAGEPPRYEIGAPELSADRKVATLPISGDYTLGSHNLFENQASSFLWRFFHEPFLSELEEGLTEPAVADATKLATNWRKPSEFWLNSVTAIPGTFLKR